jgi:hypothetical protein
VNGTVEISAAAELVISGEQLRDLWRLARERGVAISLNRKGDGYAATVSGGGRFQTSTSRSPYLAAIDALGKAA